MAELTDKILQELIEHRANEKRSLSSFDKKEILNSLKSDINANDFHLSEIEEICAIHASHLSDFLNGKRQLHRDKILALLITLHYDFDKIQSTLQKLNIPKLYVRNWRDCCIARGIQNEKSLSEIDDMLFRENLNLLAQYTRSSELQPL